MSTGLDTRPNAMTFELDDLVQRAWSGEIRIPHFQRPFRWDREDIRLLFDSIMRGYPIGSVLLWVRPAPAGNVTLGNLHIDAPEVDKALWVVDGQQRITGVANALHPEASRHSNFALSYDLRSEKFTAKHSSQDPAVVPLSVLFDGEALLEWFSDNPESTAYYKRAFAANTLLRQFKVPAYQVEQDDIQVLQDIFDRLNNYGKRLSRDEIFTALTAGAEGDAGTRLTIPLIGEYMNTERAFGVLDGGTVLKAILGRRHPDVLRGIRGEFDDRTGTEFPGESRDTAYEQAQEALLLAVAFLQEHALVPHVGMLPYRNLLIVLARFFAHHPDPGDYNRKLLVRWYWRAAVIGPEGFKGGTSGAIRALCAAVRPGDLTGSIQRLLELVGTDEHPVPDLRRFRANEARTKTALCAWWAADPRSPETGEVFRHSSLAECLTDQWTASGAVRHILPRLDVPEKSRQLAANRVLMPELESVDSEIAPLLLEHPSEITENQWSRVLESHSLTTDMLKLLRSGKAEEFLHARQELLHEGLASFLGRMCEWGFEDTPSLTDLELDDEDEDEDDDFPA